MNRHSAKMNAFALLQLGPAPADRVLEIGFGGGLNLPHLLAEAGFVLASTDQPLWSGVQQFAFGKQ